MRSYIVIALVIGLAACVQHPQQAAYGNHASAHVGVSINGIALAPEDAQRLQIPAGRYWYDSTSGLWGIEGGPPRGVTHAGLRVGGALQPYASGGNTQVALNGRILAHDELTWWQHFLGSMLPPGRYFLDHQGNLGVEGGPALVNLFAIARTRGGGGGGDNFWSSGASSSVGNESGGAGYVCTGGTCATYGM